MVVDVYRLCSQARRYSVKHIICQREDVFGPWYNKIMGQQQWLPGNGHIIGLWEDTVGPIGAALFQDHNGASILLHMAAAPGRRWLNREYLWFVFYYPFKQLGVNKIISPVASTNTDAKRFIENIGFTLEATLKDAAPKGDINIYTMTESQCRWLQLRERYRGQGQQSTRSA